MADRTIGELRAVEEASIGSLPGIGNLYDDTLVPVEQQGEARKMTGAQWKAYARDAAQQDVDRAVQAAEDASASAREAAGYAGQAGEHVQAAGTAKSEAELARDEAIAARQAIEDMSVSAGSLPAGSEATVVKTAAAGAVNLRFGIPKGEQGETGPKGDQGIQGPPGRDGISGVAVPEAGQYAFNVYERGHLMLSYTGTEAPDFEIREDGHLYLNIA